MAEESGIDYDALDFQDMAMAEAVLEERERVAKRCERLARYRGDLVTASDIRREFGLPEAFTLADYAAGRDKGNT